MHDYALIKCQRSSNYANVLVSENGLPLGELWSHLVARKVVNALFLRKSRKKDVTIPAVRSGRVRLVTSRHVETKGNVKSAKSQSGSSEFKLHIVMDKESLMRLRGLKAKLEAATESEVIRRALKAYEIFEPDDMANDPASPNPGNIAGQGEHLYVRIPNRMKERLDEEHQTSGRNPSEQVRQALRVLAQLAREMEGCKTKLTKQPNSTAKGELYVNVLKMAAAV